MIKKAGVKDQPMVKNK